MSNLLKVVFAASVIAFLASLTDAGSALAWGILKPVGALLFGAFFIGQLLQKESAKYDEELRLSLANAKAQSASTPSSNEVSSAPQRRSKPTLATAH
jgi:hypothetical protein